MYSIFGAHNIYCTYVHAEEETTTPKMRDAACWPCVYTNIVYSYLVRARNARICA